MDCITYLRLLMRRASVRATVALSALCLVLAFPFVARSAVTVFPDETLHYVISYKWGLIHKDAGEATLRLRNSGDRYLLTLYGKTKPWADKFYQVRDTLTGSVRKSGFRPLTYSKIAHEKGKYSRDDITYSYSGQTVTGTARRTRDRDGRRTVTEKTLHGQGTVLDMLSVFYFLRTIDYGSLAKGQKLKYTVFSGSKEEVLTIRCTGIEPVELRDKSRRQAYHIKFSFTSGGRSKSSDDIDTWISVADPHIPLLVIGKLPVGQVKCCLVP